MFATAEIVTLLAMVLAAGPVRAQKLSGIQRRSSPIPLATGNGNGNGNGNNTTITNTSVLPAVISFNATAPGTLIQGSSAATVAFTINSNVKGNTWTLSVGTTSTAFSGCTTVPTSAVTLWCSSAIVNGSNDNGASAACSTTTATQLPSTLPGLQVAGGSEPQSQTANYTVTLYYQLADSWKYIPNTCPLNITYTINAP